MDKKDCDKCNAACCRYVIVEIDTPENLEDFSNVRWYVAHENINVFVEEDGVWNLEFLTPCNYLDKGNKCSIHEDYVQDKIERPNICKEFTTDQCPFHNEYSELHRFGKMEDVDNYIENVFNKGLHIIPEEEDEEED